MFSRILVANRGEIACRVIRTARRLGIGTVAVFSEADRNARHVRLADEARLIGPAPARESYLNAGAIIAAARASGAAAIHPGYGFLAENEAFASACAKAGIVFVGPSPEAIAAMGDKAAAKALMEKAGVPLVPGYHGAAQDAKRLAKEAERIGFPLLVKAAAGGGGKGMRVVRSAGELGAALEGARREAAAAFGDDRVLLEKFIERPRHIEVQVFGDTLGGLVHLFERDCSVQRRYQKVIEEAPAPGMTPERRRAMGAAALAAAKAIGYVGAGTVEFIADREGRFFFMEMNTRLQVEHPVTELVTGLDLVEWQLRVAAGEPLPLAQDAIRLDGHAIEARIYAEDPAHDFLPQTGRLVHLRFPGESADVRIDSGVEPLAEIGPHYDPMIAKLVARGADRGAALARLAQALAQTEIAGPATNVAFLARIAACRDFRDANLDTALIERNAAELLAPPAEAPPALLAAAAWAELQAEQAGARTAAARSGDPHSPWHEVDGWRLNQDSHHAFEFVDGMLRYTVLVRFTDAGTRVVLGGAEHGLSGQMLADGACLIRLDERAFKARVVRDGPRWHVFCDGAYRALTLHEALAGLDADAASGSLCAPMPGKVVAMLVAVGTRVERGAPLVILEAMKMEHTITAPSDGTVAALHYAAGDQVLEGAELLKLE